MPAHIRAAAARNKEAAELRAPHEEAVGSGKPADAALLAAYAAYIAVRWPLLLRRRCRPAAPGRLPQPRRRRAQRLSAPLGPPPARPHRTASAAARPQLEKAQKAPARVALLYERALAAFPLTAHLWAQYARYLEAEVKAPDVINKVSWLAA